MWRRWGRTSEFPFAIYWWTLKNPKNQNFEKMEKKFLEISSFYTCVPKTSFCPVTSLPTSKKNKNKKQKTKKKHEEYQKMCTKNHDHRLYCSWHMACDRCNCYFLFWAIFWPFTPLTAWRMKIKKQKINSPGDIIILHKCTKNHDYMLYCSWNMTHDRCNCCFSLWAIFCPLTPITAPKMKKWKNSWRYHFTQVYQNHDHMLYCSWNMAHDTCNYFSFWAIFCALLLP